jgi:hypothetical protein
MTIFLRASRQLNPVTIDQQMPLGLGDINVPRTNPVTIHRMSSVDPAEPPQDAGERADAVSREVMDDQNRGGKLRRQVTYQLRQGFHPTCGEAHDDDVMSGH